MAEKEGEIKMNLTIQQEKIGNVMTLHLKGVLDISTTNEIDQYLPLINESIEKLIVDFNNVHFIDSTGVGTVMALIFLSADHQFKLEFVGINDMTDQIFEMVGVYQVLESVQRGVG